MKTTVTVPEAKLGAVKWMPWCHAIHLAEQHVVSASPTSHQELAVYRDVDVLQELVQILVSFQKHQPQPFHLHIAQVRETTQFV